MHEGLISARIFRRISQPCYPIELFANEHALQICGSACAVNGDDSIFVRVSNSRGLDARLQRMLDDDAASHGSSRDRDFRFLPFLFKLHALLSTNFERVLLIDTDLHVRQPSLVDSLLNATLDLAEVAAPLDPHRLRYGAKEGDEKFIAAPPLCTCLLAYRNTDQTRALWLGAAERLINVRHPSVRQSDQEVGCHAERSLRPLTLGFLRSATSKPDSSRGAQLMLHR